MQFRKLHFDEPYPIALLLEADPSMKMIEQYLKTGECFIAEIEDEIIGVYILLPTSKETIELVNIAVVEKHRFKGIGKQLVLNAIWQARLNGFKMIEVGTGNSSIGQLALYQKCGFRITGIDFNYFLHHYKEEIFENGIRCRDMIRLSQDLV